MFADLSVTPISETIRWLAAEKLSGDLQVRSARVARMVFFDHGRIVFAASNVKKERLGETLMALGSISEQDFQRASALMKGDRKLRFGEALVQAGVMEEPDVGRALAAWVERIVLSLFNLPQGIALFDQRACSIPLEFMVGLSVHRMLYLGIRTITNRDLAISALGHLDQKVKLAEVAPFSFDVKKCSADELDVLKRAREGTTVRGLAMTPAGLGLARLQLVYALLVGGILESAEAQPAPAPRPQLETNSFLLSDVQRKIRAKAHEAVREEIDAELELSAHLDPDAWLKVSRTGPKEEIEKAVAVRLERYRGLKEKAAGSDDLKTDIEMLEGRARALLQQRARVPPPPDGVSPSGPPTANPAPSAAPTPNPAAVSPPAAQPSPVPASATAGMQIEHLMMEASVRLSVGDYASAVQSYGRLVDIQPDVAAHRLRLAIAMARWPQTARRAEREFMEAARLDPDNPELHYQIGLYYKTMNVRARAVAAFRNVLRLNPRHKGARAELEALSPQDSALTSLKKLLR